MLWATTNRERFGKINKVTTSALCPRCADVRAARPSAAQPLQPHVAWQSHHWFCLAQPLELWAAAVPAVSDRQLRYRCRMGRTQLERNNVFLAQTNPLLPNWRFRMKNNRFFFSLSPSLGKEEVFWFTDEFVLFAHCIIFQTEARKNN